MKKIFLLWFIFLILQSCMTERNPLDKTSQKALNKKMFEGEFLYKQTITDLPYSVDYAFIGESNDTKIVKFEITEDWLFVYNVHEKINVTTTEGEDVKSKTPVLAFKIRKHFDMINAENTTTGEDLPVLEENTDKPWHERRYFEVDFSQNNVTGFEMKYLEIVKAFDDPFTREPVGAYYNLEFYDNNRDVLNPKKYDENIQSGDSSKLVDVISMNTEEIFTPKNDWENIYSWEDVEEYINMEPARIVYRHYFKKIDREERDSNGFSKMEFQDDLFRHFGYFTTDVRDYDHNAGYKDSDVHRYANYYNVSGGKIVYYLSPGFPERMKPAACAIAADYNYALKKARFAKEHPGEADTYPKQDQSGDIVDYLSTDAGIIAGQLKKCFAEKEDDIFVLRENEILPYDEFRDGYDLNGKRNSVVIDGKEYACKLTPEHSCLFDDKGNGITRYRFELGDLEHSFIYWVPAPTEYGILGVAQWSADPETGQIYSGTAHIAGSVLQWAVTRAMELYDYLSGNIEIADFENPLYGKVPDVILSSDGNQNNGDGTGISRSSHASVEEKLLYLQQKFLPLDGRLNLEAIKETKFETMMIPEGLKTWVFPNATSMSESMIDMLSPLKWGTPESIQKIFDREILMGKGCYYLPEFLDSAVIAYIAEKVKAGADRETVRAEIEKIMFKAVAEHEVGHTVGLRHNFKGSMDEANFGDGYFEHKEEFDKKIAEYKNEHPDATGRDIFEYGKTIPSIKDYWAYASVMDYQREFYQHGHGLGRYDTAALKFVYGKAVEKLQQVSEGVLDVVNVPYIGEDGKLIIESEKEIVSEDGKLTVKDKFKKDAAGMTVKDENGNPVQNLIDILSNGDTKPYAFCSDEKIFEDPMCNTFDKGTTAREIARNHIDQLNKYYYLLNFRRGNPKYRVSEWYRSFVNYFKLAQFALDFNYNLTHREGWLDVLFDGTKFNKEYADAVDGKEDNLSAGGPGDYVVAAMEGFNYLVFDVVYRPDVNWHISTSAIDDKTKKYFITNPYVVTGNDLKYAGIYDYFLSTTEFGRYHRNYWDIMGDEDVYYEKLVRKGFTVEKDAALFVLTNSGWPVKKYMRENMANSYSIFSEGFENVLYRMLSDITNEDSMLSFSRYCASEKISGAKDKANSRKIAKMEPSVASLMRYNAKPSFADLPAFEPPKDYCGGNLLPVHASWIYFDKMFPIIWAMYNMANIMADNTVFQYFASEAIPASEIGNHAPLDPENEVQFLNLGENTYYRAHKFAGTKVSPVYELVKRAAVFKEMVGKDNNATAHRFLEFMESTIILMNDFAGFWTSTSGLIFG